MPGRVAVLCPRPARQPLTNHALDLGVARLGLLSPETLAQHALTELEELECDAKAFLNHANVCHDGLSIRHWRASVPHATGIGIIMTPLAMLDGVGSNGSRSACRKITSSSRKPPAGVTGREQRPPIDRGAISTTKIPSALTRASAWIGPIVRPMVAAAAVTCAAISWWRRRGRRDGVT